MTPWKYLPDQHCYSALRGRCGLRVQKRSGAWQWVAERMAIGSGCEIVSGACETRPEAQATAIDATNRLEET